MKERPILFSLDMVQAIISCRKTMTRRAINPQPTHFHSTKCKYGVVGDRLWVKETWAASRLFDLMPPRYIPKNADLFFKADGGDNWNQCAKIRPSIFMLRWASRITLEIADIRVERLQDISEEDAEREGVDFLRHAPDADETLSAKQLFHCLWDAINEKRGFGWDQNPWVWAIEFKYL